MPSPACHGDEARPLSAPWTRILKGNVVLVGIGNPLRGDDAFGPRLVSALEGKVRAACIDAGGTPENHLGRIAKSRPDTILLIDAVHLGLPPGEHAVLTGEELLRTGFSTHDLSPALLIQHLESECGAAVYLLGVQPEDVSLGAEMSGAVAWALEELAADLREALRA